MKMKGLVFDKDGTLFDFNATWAAFAKSTLSELARDQAHLEQLAEVMGYDLEAVRFLPNSCFISETMNSWASRIAPYLGMDLDEVKGFFHDRSLYVEQVPTTDLDRFFLDLKREGYLLGIATNDSERPARAHLTAHGILEHFDFIAGSDSGFGAKPAAGQLEAFCAATGLLPENCAMIGDSPHDLRAGRAAQMCAIGVLTGPMPREVLEPDADTILTSIQDLPAWLTQRLQCTLPE